jgi:hypothetical protein
MKYQPYKLEPVGIAVLCAENKNDFRIYVKEKKKHWSVFIVSENFRAFHYHLMQQITT